MWSKQLRCNCVGRVCHGEHREKRRKDESIEEKKGREKLTPRRRGPQSSAEKTRAERL
jgi:hypothetical protein